MHFQLKVIESECCFFSLSVGLLVQLYPQVEVDVKVESKDINCFFLHLVGLLEQLFPQVDVDV